MTSPSHSSSVHPLDEALRLVPSSTAAGQYEGSTHPGYWNMVGPFGGITAATLLQAILQHAQRLGDPLSLTVNYAGALSAGPFTVQATPVRSHRHMQSLCLTLPPLSTLYLRPLPAAHDHATD